MWETTYSQSYLTIRSQHHGRRTGFDPETGLPLNFSPIGKLKVRPENFTEYYDEYREWDAANALADREYRGSLNVNKLRKHLDPNSTAKLGNVRTAYRDDYPGYDGARKRGPIRNLKAVKSAGQPAASETTYGKDYTKHPLGDPTRDDRLRTNPNVQRRYLDAGRTMPFNDENGGTYKDEFKNWGPQEPRKKMGPNGGDLLPSQPFTGTSLYHDSFVKPTRYPTTFKRGKDGAGMLPQYPFAGSTMYRGDYCKSGIGRPDFASSVDFDSLRQVDSRTLKGEHTAKFAPYTRDNVFKGETEYVGEICRQGDIAPAYLKDTFKGHQDLWRTSKSVDVGATMRKIAHLDGEEEGDGNVGTGSIVRQKTGTGREGGRTGGALKNSRK